MESVCQHFSALRKYMETKDLRKVALADLT
jgi:hypothetical protein